MIKKKISSKLKSQIEIFEQFQIPDEMGGVKYLWQTKFYLPAMTENFLSFSKKSEYFVAMQTITYNMMLFTIRFRDDITNKMRIKYKDKIYDIIRLCNHKEENLILQVLAKEAVHET